MNNFEYYAPTKIIFGKGSENNIARELCKFGASKVLILYGKESAKKSGLLDRVQDNLTDKGIDFISLGGVVPNPRVTLVRKGIELCRKENVDFILAVGGGSVIDSAKAIALGFFYNGDVWDLYEGSALPNNALPIGCILTIAASGSEMSNSSVITNEKLILKRGLGADIVRLRFSILNPELTLNLPPFQTACGIADIMMHTMERYFSPSQNVNLTDHLCEGLLKSVIENGLKLIANPNDYNARAEIMWAGSLSHNGLMGTGRLGDWACHQLAHEPSGMFDITHGAALSAIWASWARYVYMQDAGRFARFARHVWDLPQEGRDQETLAATAIDATEMFFHSLGLPTSLSQLPIDKVLNDNLLETMADRCSLNGKRSIGTFMELHKDDMFAIYKMAVK